MSHWIRKKPLKYIFFHPSLILLQPAQHSCQNYHIGTYLRMSLTYLKTIFMDSILEKLKVSLTATCLSTYYTESIKFGKYEVANHGLL